MFSRSKVVGKIEIFFFFQNNGNSGECLAPLL